MDIASPLGYVLNIGYEIGYVKYNIAKRKYEVHDVDGRLAGQLSVDGEQAGHMDLLDFSKAFANLPEEQREALILVGAEGFAYEEAARMCGCAVGTIKSRVNRARVKLVELLDAEDSNAVRVLAVGGGAAR